MGKKSNYFRHIFNAHKDEKIMELIERGGIKCVGVYFVLLEIYGSMIIDDDENKEIQKINARLIANSVGLRSDSARTCIELLADCNLIEAVHRKSKVSYFEVSIPNFAKYFGRYSKTETIKCPNKRKEKKTKEKERKVNESKQNETEKTNIIPQQIFQLFISKFTGILKIPKILGDCEINNINIISEKYLKNNAEWNAFFEYALNSNLIMGKDSHEWKPSLRWMTEPQNAVKIINEEYDAAFNKKESFQEKSDREENEQFENIMKMTETDFS